MALHPNRALLYICDGCADDLNCDNLNKYYCDGSDLPGKYKQITCQHCKNEYVQNVFWRYRKP